MASNTSPMAYSEMKLTMKMNLKMEWNEMEWNETNSPDQFLLSNTNRTKAIGDSNSVSSSLIHLFLSSIFTIQQQEEKKMRFSHVCVHRVCIRRRPVTLLIVHRSFTVLFKRCCCCCFFFLLNHYYNYYWFDSFTF